MSASAQQQSAPRPKRAAWRVVTVFVGLAAVSIGMAALAPTASANPSKGGSGDGSQSNPYSSNSNIAICHGTASFSNPYTSESPDANSIVKQSGHDSHNGPFWGSPKANGVNWGDIIPSFWYYPKGKTTPTYYVGKNWPGGQAILKNDCDVTAKVTVNKVWVINGVTYYVPTPKHGSPLPRGYSSSLTLTKRQSADWGKEYNGYQDGDSVTIGENATVPDGCTDTVTGDTGSKTLVAGRNTFTVTNTVTCVTNVTITLDKKWVGASRGSSDAVSLTIGAEGATAGSSPANGRTTEARATVHPGDSVTLSEAYTNENPDSYDSTLKCKVKHGNWSPVDLDGLSGTFTIPANAKSVECKFTNTRKGDNPPPEPSTVNLTKIWDNADEGDSVELQLTNDSSEDSDSADATAGETSGIASVDVSAGNQFTLSETAGEGTDLSHYDPTYACYIGDSQLDPDSEGGATFTAPESLEAGSTIDCTITNTHKPSTTVTVTKKWVTPDGDFEVPGDGEGPEWQTNYDAQLQIDGQDADWGEPVEVITDDFSADDIFEDPVTVPAGCKATPSIEKVERTETYRSQSVRNVDYVQYVVTNTVTCTPPDSSSNPSSPSSSQQTTTPAETTTEVVETAPVTTESPEVLGASEETTTAEVLGVSSVVAAPSANAHTGQSTSGWAYLLLAAGVAMMLGAGIRKRRRA